MMLCQIIMRREHETTRATRRITYSVSRLRGDQPNARGVVETRLATEPGLPQSDESEMNFRLLVEFDPECQRWSAVFPELPGCTSAGDTEAEAIENANEALALWLEPSPLATSPSLA